MDYEKKYKETLKKIENLRGYSLECNNMIDELFPELKESEGEWIRKELIEYLNDVNPNSPLIQRWIAWLGKQGEQKPADKVEPKFKVGDWVTDGEYTWKVTNIKRLDYILQSQNGDIVDDTTSYVDEHFYLWTIEDAKDGDVLVSKSTNKKDIDICIFKCFSDIKNSFTAYCSFVGSLNRFDSREIPNWNKDFFIPATKEQCELLFSKMKEAGYEWDADKKELKNIEQKSALSEEDEKMLKEIVSVLEGNNVRTTKMLCEYANWLKSLKPQSQWKPTKEQMEDLKYAINMVDKCCEDSLQSLYEELVKLYYDKR